MKGPSKKKFFDFVQAELELSLEKLSMLLQQDLTEFIEMGEDKTISLKQDYFDFKKESTLLMNAVKNHFEKLLKEMRADFPTVEENEEM